MPKKRNCMRWLYVAAAVGFRVTPFALSTLIKISSPVRHKKACEKTCLLPTKMCHFSVLQQLLWSTSYSASFWTIWYYVNEQEEGGKEEVTIITIHSLEFWAICFLSQMKHRIIFKVTDTHFFSLWPTTLGSMPRIMINWLDSNSCCACENSCKLQRCQT